MQPYQQLFDKVLTRTDPEKAHHAAFRAIRAAQPVTRLVDGRRPRVQGPHARRVMGLDFPGLLGLAAGFDKNARRHRRAGQHGLRVRRDRHRHGGAAARQPEATAGPPAGRPRGGQPDGLQQRRRRGGRAPARRAPAGPHRPSRSAYRSASTSARPRWCPRSTPSATTRRAPPCSRRTPTTWSSTSPRRTLPGCATCRPSSGSSRCCGPSARRADDVSDRHVPLLVKIAPDLDDEDVLAVADLAIALGLDGIVATNTTISPRRAGQHARAGRGGRRRRALRAAAARRAPPRCSGCCATGSVPT